MENIQEVDSPIKKTIEEMLGDLDVDQNRTNALRNMMVDLLVPVVKQASFDINGDDVDDVTKKLQPFNTLNSLLNDIEASQIKKINVNQRNSDSNDLSKNMGKMVTEMLKKIQNAAPVMGTATMEDIDSGKDLLEAMTDTVDIKDAELKEDPLDFEE